MCMSDVRPPVRLAAPYPAYKVGSRGSRCVGPVSSTAIVFGVWMEARFEPARKVPVPYQPGFHVFRTLKAARRWACYGEPIYRVLIHGVVTPGKTSDVSREMWALDDAAAAERIFFIPGGRVGPDEDG